MYHISLEEALVRGEESTPEEAMFAYDIALATYHELGRDAEPLVYGTCFHAGIIEGIRRERARRKEQQESKEE